MAVQRELFVIMPFTEPWSDGVHSFIRRVAALLGASHGQLYLYRADEIAVPGRITDQIREALASADVVIADITGLNPNVMWELGCADGLGKTSVILNQNPGSSPFDLGDRRKLLTICRLLRMTRNGCSAISSQRSARATPVTRPAS